MTATETASACFEVGCDADTVIAAIGHLAWMTGVLSVLLLACLVSLFRDVAELPTPEPEENDQ